jgi:transposase
MKPPEIVTATRAELDEILVLTKPILPARHYQLLEGVFGAYEFVMLKLQDAKMSLQRLKRMLFGAPTEHKRNLIKDAAAEAAAQPGAADAACDGNAVAVAVVVTDAADAPLSAASPKKKRKGHGRNGAQAYRDAPVVECVHAHMQAGKQCPQCGVGRVYESPPKVIVKVVGQAPLAATVYRLHRLRCRLCDAIFTAPAPAAVDATPKYDASCASMIAVLRYGYGMPFYRLQALQASLHVPLPDATQWEIVEQAVRAPHCVYKELIGHAAQAPLLHNDDTPARVLALMAQRKKAEAAGESTSKAINTSGIVALLGEHRVVLFFTGHAHAGQNLQKVLTQRAQELEPPMQMCDALPSNMAGEFATILAHCLAHGRRKVVDVLEHFPEHGRHVIELLGRVYAFDEHCREHKLTPGQRLAYHQEHSGPLMQQLKTWMNEQFEQRLVEPNSGLGQALNYLRKHWEPLTLFLRRAGAPLDNNICERALKMAIRHRKNSLFYKTSRGAQVGDVYMSLIHTCALCGVNAFEYLNALQLHAEDVMARAAQWLPWNFHEQLAPSG